MLKITVGKTRRTFMTIFITSIFILFYLLSVTSYCFANDSWQEAKDLSFKANVAFSKPLTGKYNHGTYNYDEGQDDVKITATGNLFNNNGVIIKEFYNLPGVLVHGKDYDYFQFDIDYFRLHIWDRNSEIFKKVFTKSNIVSQEKVQQKSTQFILPHFTLLLDGNNEVRVRNPNNYEVTVGLRAGKSGKDFEVVSNGVASVFVPDGIYQIYFIYSDKPNALFQGDDFSLSNNGIEIEIVKVVGGNFGIKQVK